MSKRPRPAYSGPALFSYGFRPFFLGAGLFGLIAVPVWMFTYDGLLAFEPGFPPLEWHIHEMIFGYTAAVIAGFLFTAIPNWTGRMPTRGWPLAILALFWLSGRLAMAGFGGLQGLNLALVEGAFLLAVAAMVLVEIVAGKNWRNLIVAAPVLMLLFANLYFHYEVASDGSSDQSRRLSLAAVVFLVTLIGGRIIPSFTRNWLVKQNGTHLPAVFGGFDRICLLAGSLSLALWVVLPENILTRFALGFAAVLHLLRMARWQGFRTTRSFLLLMLHIAYLFIPFGLTGLALGFAESGMHLLGVGAIGGMTTAVMSRATLGHTGRDLKAGIGISLVFLFVVLAAILRSVFSEMYLFNLSGIWLAALSWALGFAVFLVVVGPWLAQPKLAARKANGPKTTGQ